MLWSVRRNTLLGIVTCAGVLWGCGDDPPSAGEFRALSYNVAGLPEAFSGSEPETNMPLISPLLNDYALVVTQEDWGETTVTGGTSGIAGYHDLLAADAEHPYQSEPAPLPVGTDPSRPEAQMSDGLNRFSDFPFEELMRVPWEDCFGGADTSDGGAGDCLAFKGFSVASHFLPGDLEVHVYNLHGEAGATELDQTLQEEGFAMLSEFIQSHSEGVAVILAGDTNLHTHDDHPDGDGDADLMIWQTFQSETGLTDVCNVVDPCERGIDKAAFRSSDEVVLEPLAQEYAREDFLREDGEPLSDHPPLVVDFAWSRPMAE